MTSRRDPSWRLRGFARKMRHEPTDAERLLWARLRDRRLGGFKFRRQVPIAGFIVDFYCDQRKIAVELDGGQHTEETSTRYDERRDRELGMLGLRVLRFSNVDVLRDLDAVCVGILSALGEEPSPLPSPGVPGEGVRATPPGVPGEGVRATPRGVPGEGVGARSSGVAGEAVAVAFPGVAGKSSDGDLLFVYGTLLPGLEPAGMRPVCQQLVAIGPATIRGDLYDLGPYPGVILDGAAGRVRGQVVRVPSADLWRRIDAYEACPQPGSTHGLFRRVRTIATLEHSARDVECWVYVYNHPVRAERRVAGGCWLTHRQDPRI